MFSSNAPPPKGVIELGSRWEHLARRVVFDITDWVETFGPGRAALFHQRQGDAAPYPVTVRRTGDNTQASNDTPEGKEVILVNDSLRGKLLKCVDASGHLPSMLGDVLAKDEGSITGTVKDLLHAESESGVETLLKRWGKPRFMESVRGV